MNSKRRYSQSHIVPEIEVPLTEIDDEDDLSLVAEICSTDGHEIRRFINRDQAVPVVAENTDDDVDVVNCDENAVDVDFWQETFVSKQLNQVSPSDPEPSVGDFQPEIEDLPESVEIGENDLDDEEGPEPIALPPIKLCNKQKQQIIHAPPKKTKVGLPFESPYPIFLKLCSEIEISIVISPFPNPT